MTHIYRGSFGFFLSALPALLIFATVIEGLLWVFQPKSGSAGTFVALTIIAYYFHRHFLFGEALTFKTQPAVADGAPPMKFGWFMLISAALIAVPVGMALAMAFQYPSGQVLGVMLIVLFPLYLLMLSLFGMALPAAVARDGTYRLAQGIRFAIGTMWRLIVGPGLVGLILLAATLGGGYAVDTLGVPERSLILLAWYIVLRTLGFLTTILAVAVLCEMYCKSRPAPRSGQKTGPSAQMPA